MSILEKRQDIIQNNNTAQIQLDTILGSLDQTITQLYINEPLYGNIDFSVLTGKGFNHVNDIFLSKGELTEIVGLPEHLIKLECSDQLLIHIHNLPSTLLELICENNYLESIDLSDTPALTVLNVANNKLKSIINLPLTIVELDCNHNELTELNLIEYVHLKQVNCSHNKLVHLNIADSSIQMIKDDDIELTYVNLESAQTGGESPTPVIDFQEALNVYFKLKSSYEQSLTYEKRKVYEKAIAEQKGKKQAIRLANQVQIPCIGRNCKKASIMGTVFKSTVNEKGHFQYSASCKNTADPCSLDIRIENGDPVNINSFFNMMHDLRESTKIDIIKQKLDALFKYTSEEMAIREFKEKIEEYNEITQSYIQYITKYNHFYKDPERELLIQKKKETIYHAISSIKDLIIQYEETQDESILKNAIQIQITELNPEIIQLQKLKYEILEVDSIAIKKPNAPVIVEGDEAEDKPSIVMGSKVFKEYSSLQKKIEINNPRVVRFSR
jgi:hypothetical protein